MKIFESLKMEKRVKRKNSVGSVVTNKCSRHCLRPLTFHSWATGDRIHLSPDGLQAERIGDTFRDGLVFTSRPVRVQERVHVRVQKEELFKWQGAMRIGFTSVPPSDRSLPLPRLAIPNLTQRPGHWAAPVPESQCSAGSELVFWVSAGGNIYVERGNTRDKLLSGVDLSQPLWAMIDIYGQTRSIFLLGSEMKSWFCKRKSCTVPVPELPISPNDSCHLNSNASTSRYGDECVSNHEMDMSADETCVVCMQRTVDSALPCGHKCLCYQCTSRVLLQFGTCPLCREDIRSLLIEWRGVSG
uniref:Neuralized E3 ubiquitin protein ligase 3 n=1 Tax=Oryzias latipes TaxID=8090 RepID=A0A3P9K9L4_ORYLA